MTQLAIKDARNKQAVIPMNKLKNGEFAIVVDDSSPAYAEYLGHLVMRTFATTHFEVIDLTSGDEKLCWVFSKVSIKVVPVDAVTITIEDGDNSELRR